MSLTSAQKLVLITSHEQNHTQAENEHLSASYHCHILNKDTTTLGNNPNDVGKPSCPALSTYGIGIPRLYYTPYTTLPQTNSKPKKSMTYDELAIWQALKACGKNKRQLENIFKFLNCLKTVDIGDSALFTRHVKGEEVVLRPYIDVSFSDKKETDGGEREYVHTRTIDFNPLKHDLYAYDGPIRIVSGSCLWNRRLLEMYQTHPSQWEEFSSTRCPATLNEADSIITFSKAIAEIVCLLPDDVDVEVELDIPFAQYVVGNPLLMECNDEKFGALLKEWMGVVEQRHERVYRALKEAIEGFVKRRGVDLSERNVKIKKTEGLKDILPLGNNRIDVEEMMTILRNVKLGWTELVDGSENVPNSVIDVMGSGYVYEILRPLLEFRAKSKSSINNCFDSLTYGEEAESPLDMPPRPESQTSSTSSTSTSPWSTPSVSSSTSNVSSIIADASEIHNPRFLTILVDRISEWKIMNNAQTYLHRTTKKAKAQGEVEGGEMSVIALYLSEKIFVTEREEIDIEKETAASTLYEFHLDDGEKVREVLSVVHGEEVVEEVLGKF